MNQQILEKNYDGQKPWHQSAFNLTPNENIETWIQKSGMDWNINESPVHFNTKQEGDEGHFQSYQDKKVLYRSDNGIPLSVVGQNYKVVQPREILEFYRDLTEVSGYQLETAGIIKGGKKLWALARLPQEAVLKGNDKVKSYLLFGTACDGSLASTITPTSLRVVCSNSLSFALNGAAEAIKIPHSTIFNAQAVKRQLGIAVSGWDNFMYQMKQLSERKVKPQECQVFFEQVFYPDNQPTEQKRNDRAIKVVQSLFDGKGKGSMLASSEGTAFGLLNAVTEYIDHEKRARNHDYRLDSAWFGHGNQIKQNALETALELIK
jgi:phage/plasmid-like protein (TIGR03299 family)